MAVHRELGCGFLEAVSREAFTIELEEQGIYGEVLVELKALHAIGPIETAQLINYLRAAGRNRGLLLNFGAPSLQHKRIVLDLADDPVSRS